MSLPAAFAQGEGAAAVATTIVTALPKGGEAAPPVPQSSFTLKVDGKAVQPTIWQPYGQGEVQLVLLIDNSLRTSFARNLEDLANFINALPPNISIGIAYMQNGAALFNQPFTKDHAAAAKTLHIPAGTAGSNASPYFCLQDLARRWPAAQSGARREVMMITDGVDEYNLRYDPEDPYVRAAVDDSNRSGMVVFPVYFRDQGRLGNSRYETDAGQNYLFQVADATGGNMYYEGLSNPVSLTPFLQDLTRRLQNQYELGVPVKPEKKVTFADLKLKTENGAMKLKAANRVVVPAASTGPM
ncbi:hypothetical protein D1Y84_12435 [Acidipila sp. EB88]|nr:hypothetical protein D1Y84_12435 [Acidipila sp. EB88]